MFRSFSAHNEEISVLQSLVPEIWQKYSEDCLLEREDGAFKASLINRGNEAFCATTGITAVLLYNVLKRHADFKRKPKLLLLPVPLVLGVVLGDWARKATIRPMWADALKLNTGLGTEVRARFSSRCPLSPLLQQALDSLAEEGTVDLEHRDRFLFAGDTDAFDNAGEPFNSTSTPSATAHDQQKHEDAQQYVYARVVEEEHTDNGGFGHPRDRHDGDSDADKRTRKPRTRTWDDVRREARMREM